MFDADAAVSTAKDCPGAAPGAHRRRGRPLACPEPERRRVLLEAAAREFVEQGYAGASMDAVARRAGMSKRTLYQLFPTKDALFGAMAAGRIATVLPVIDPGNTRGLPPRAVL